MYIFYLCLISIFVRETWREETTWDMSRCDDDEVDFSELGYEGLNWIEFTQNNIW
jgi:hypothetical protein